jgi:hypothetical protein
MKTYYSIVSIATKPQLNEKFNIGLLCVTPEKTFFHFSEAKFKIVSKLLSSNASKLALSALKGMDIQINESALNGDPLFNENEPLNAVSETYLSYLSRYNNNLVQFTAPENIDLEIDWEVFKVLFKKYIFAKEVFEKIAKPQKPKFETIRKSFRTAAQEYANTNFKVNNEIIKDLLAPVTVDVFGKNGAFVTGQSLDFNKSSAFLQNDISSYMYLVLSTEMIDNEAKCFVLGEEPSKTEEQNHKLWKNVYESNLIDFVPLDESEQIIDYMKINGVAPIV